MVGAGLELTWTSIGVNDDVASRVLTVEVAWYHSSGEVLMDEKKAGAGRMGRCARVRGT